MSEQVIISLIQGGATTLAAAAAGVFGLLINRKVNGIRTQVANHHKVNLRDDLDDKHEENADLLKTLARDVGGMKSDVRLIRKTQFKQDRRLLRLEGRKKP
ncbi:hypothetical protein BWO91_17265 [Plantibacter flavus]|uniref:DUF2746 domain-containing protein n=1 Tax=Plantibacter flavus TaxID=150123 RepID=UPI00099B39E3|nr:DUF2746 domain-containing protein [Plantibacter flavus]AQX81476.1 hypothetical protein BWO91_17265 [Plantibacter flavus]